MATRKPARSVIRASIKAWMAAHDENSRSMAYRMRMSESSWFRRMRNPEKMTVKDLERIEFITGLKVFNREESV